MSKRSVEEVAQMILDTAYDDESKIEGLSDEEDDIPVALTVPGVRGKEIEIETQDKNPEPLPKKVKKK